jgi:hypothetical protein
LISVRASRLATNVGKSEKFLLVLNFGGYPVNQAPQSFQKGFRIHFVKVGRIPSKLFKQFQMSRADDNEDAILAWFRDPIDVCENSQISLVPIGHPSPPFYKLWDRL